MKSVIFSVNLLVLLLSLSFGVNAQGAGSLDMSFGSGGIVTNQLNITTTIYDIAIQTDKKIIAVGYTMNSMGNSATGMIARFNENGSIDSTFDENGYNNSYFMKSVYAVRILENGKILVGGNTAEGNFSIARFNPDGSLDSTFNGTGIIVTPVGYNSSIRSINILPNGKIVAVGITKLFSNSQYDFALVKYNADGSLDTGFGTNGRVAIDFGSDEWASDSAIQSDGKIVVSGSYLDALSSQWNAAIIRLNTDGSLDTTFGNNGKVLRPATSLLGASDIVIQSDGKIIIGGDGFPPARYNSNGTLDLDFNVPSGGFGLALKIQSNGKILVSRGGANNTYFLSRFNINGTLDNSFGNGGSVSTNAIQIAISIAPDGKIVTAGNTSDSLRLSRYLNNRPPFMDFDGDGKTDVSIFRPSNGQWWFLRSSDNSNYALQFGVSDDKIVPADYTGDGKTDVAVFRLSTGEWFVLRSEDFTYYAFPFGISSDAPVPADYDGDGKADAAVFRAPTGTWYINNSSNGGTLVTNFGVSGDRPVPADYDGDGKADIAIYRPTGGNAPWWIKRSSNESIFTVITPSANARVTTGDFTGDGKSDFVYFFGASQTWYVVRSENMVTTEIPFGQTGDVLTPGDYDGDGKIDAATFRPSNNTWNIRHSSDGGTVQQTFGTTGDIPTPSVNVR